MANPTTNYGFVLPTPNDLVTDLPADFDVALQGVDTRLKALQPGTTLGDLAYSSATANTNTRLGIGTTGQVLAVSGGVPAWTTPAVASSGLVLIRRATFSAVASTTTSFDNVFNSTYSSYLIVADGLFGSSAAAFIQMQMRLAGATLSAANWYGSFSGFNYSSNNTLTNRQGDTSLTFCQVDTNLGGCSTLQLYITNVGVGTSTTRINGTFSDGNRSYGGSGFGFYGNAAGNDGFILSLSSGNISGKVSVYGLAIV